MKHRTEPAGRTTFTQNRWIAVVLFAVVALLLVTARVVIWGSPGTAAGLVSDLAFALALAMLISFAPGWVAGLLAVVVAGFLSAATLSATIYADYYNAVPTVDMLAFFGQAAEMQANIVESWTAASWVFVIAPLIIVAAVFVRAKRLRPRATHYAVLAVSLAVFAAATISLAATQGPVDSLGASRARGLMSFQAASFALNRPAPVAAATEDVALAKKVDSILERDTAKRIAPFKPGTFAGKNVIVVQFEALQSHMIDYKIGDTVITPNLNRLKSESWYFPNGVAMIAKGNTSDAEWVANTATYPSLAKASSLQWWDKEAPGLPRLLGDRGYTSVTMHTNDASFWNRRQMYEAIGFSKYYDLKHFGAGPWLDGQVKGDDALYSMSMPILKDLSERDEPFYAYMVTVSSHSPYTRRPEHEPKLNLPAPYAGTELAGYAQAMNNADKEFGVFMDDLEKAGILEDTIVVVFGDHVGPKAFGEVGTDEVENDYVGREFTGMDKLTVPVLIRLPGGSGHRVVADPVGEIDLMPTIADLLGVDLSNLPHFGRSAFERGRILLAQRRYVAEGSYVVREGLVELTGLGFEDAMGRPVMGSDVPVPVNIRDFEDAQLLVQLSDSYANSLPARASAVEDTSAIIPTKSGRGE